ncbi:unnamed protein product [Arctogadus glacialis]
MNDVVQRRLRECYFSTTSTGSVSERSLAKLQASVSRCITKAVSFDLNISPCTETSLSCSDVFTSCPIAYCSRRGTFCRAATSHFDLGIEMVLW